MNISVIISSLLSGLLGSMGLGGGTVLIIYLVNFLGTEQLRAQGINLIMFIPCALISVINYCKSGLIKLRPLTGFILLSLAGAAAGYVIVKQIPSALLGKLFGGLLVIFGLRELFSKSEKKTDGKTS
ncbi:MAG: TSUP family transporter [Acutalibacteraceae bacterium]